MQALENALRCFATRDARGPRVGLSTAIEYRHRLGWETPQVATPSGVLVEELIDFEMILSDVPGVTCGRFSAASNDEWEAATLGLIEGRVSALGGPESGVRRRAVTSGLPDLHPPRLGHGCALPPPAFRLRFNIHRSGAGFYLSVAVALCCTGILPCGSGPLYPVVRLGAIAVPLGSVSQSGSIPTRVQVLPPFYLFPWGVPMIASPLRSIFLCADVGAA
ncbi:hypothetical protein NDU88_003660 [Pleurodeles waltl]|uniref:Uncharacterized protein n=1 Tax=Pleurodeles waltl TaxID=8319 RepID=A0AAV7UD57_PLEWA|nr:hypothetical protein NDU88_003660 [Pleurodeles waltl]